ncbi:MAG TPA: hypothetical protein VF623_02050 [Segetibacter sp.]
MVKKISAFIIILIGLANALHAQNFRHSAGASAATMWATLFGPQKQGPFSLQTVYITYFPRINFPIMDGSSISAGVPISVGMGTMNNSMFNARGSAFSYDVPFVLDYNNGFKTGEPGDDLFGFYFGVGIGYTSTKFDSLGITTASPKDVSFLIRGGARFGFFQVNDELHHGITIGLFHKAGLSIDRFKTVGVNLLFDF